ncbi:hypothetical protein BLA13014_07242 [Burkholderia aenigmatica]|uniref:Uncharacterized protein n=1 Tax=Burkholderia aenigmatica TaxID=2015348 RepID=A0A6P2SH39_9BURK|nr:hypothetical protein BLA13014_07242 [Burkholderia aenigmatica]
MPFRPTNSEYEPTLTFDNSHWTPVSTAREPAWHRGPGRGCDRRRSRYSHSATIGRNDIISGTRPPPPS